MTEYDFKGALAFIECVKREYGTREEYRPILFALRLADKVTQEPSEGMVISSQVYVHSYDVKLIHKAMISQAIKEVSGD